MTIETVYSLTKDRLGIKSTVRDTYIQAIVDSVVSELETVNALVVDYTNSNHLMFIVDFATWRYENKGSMDGMPRHLQFRLHNLIVSNGGVPIV